MSPAPVTRFVLFAANQVGADALRIVAGDPRCRVDHVFSYDLPLDRAYGFEPIEAVARELDVPYSDRTAVSAIRERMEPDPPDYVLSVYYRRILPRSVWTLARKGAFNLHPGRLPWYRGPTPTGWALLHGEREAGITLHAIDEGIDTGDVLERSSVPIDDDDTGFTLYCKAMVEGAALLHRVLPRLIEGDLRLVPQRGAGSYHGPIRAIGHAIHWHESAELVLRKIRVLTRPYGGMRAELMNKAVVVYAARLARLERPLQGPGRIVAADGARLTVSCADGYIELVDYEMVPELTEAERGIYLAVGNRFSV